MYPSTFFFCRFLSCPVLHQLNPKHQPFSANVADQIVLPGEFMKSTDQMISNVESVLLQLFPVDHLQHRATLGTNDWIASEGIKMDSFSQTLRNRRCRYYRGERNPVSDPFRHGYDVRYHTLTFKSPIGLTGTTKPSLDFVRDADTSGCSHMFIDMLEIVIWKQNGPANSLN